jgi:DNA-binding transcriptional LysR family regulator
MQGKARYGLVDGFKHCISERKPAKMQASVILRTSGDGKMDNWDELRTAYHVARMGTVSGAAEVLGVHHATVIRHVDALEARLGIKLFQRHARGYTPTEAGEDVMRVAQATDDQFSQLISRIKGQGEAVTGELVITSLSAFSELITPVVASFQQDYPEISVKFLTGERLFKLEYGEAHVAIRAGTAPEQPDNVVQMFFEQTMGLYASTAYIERHGRPETTVQLAAQRFIGPDDETSRAPFNDWLRDLIGTPNIVFRSTSGEALKSAVQSGIGIGFLPRISAESLPDVEEIWPAEETWKAQIWLVTHVDLHRTTKVQTFLKYLKEHTKAWR